MKIQDIANADNEIAPLKRAPFQVLVLPFRRQNRSFQYAIFKRSDFNYWQGIAGGGTEGETPAKAAAREGGEEAGIPVTAEYVALESVCSVPRCSFSDVDWPNDVFVIPEYTFAVDCTDIEITLSPEHAEFRWDEFETCSALLKWDSNKTALWELNQKLLSNSLRAEL